MSKLYEITAEYRHAIETLEGIEDMPADCIRDTLEGIQGEFKDKALAVAAAVLNAEAEAKAMKEAEGNMARRRKAREAFATSMRDYLAFNMKTSAIETITSPQYDLKFKKNPKRVEITDEQAIRDMGDAYLRCVPATSEIDVDGIGKALKAGLVVEGARLVQGERLEIK